MRAHPKGLLAGAFAVALLTCIATAPPAAAEETSSPLFFRATDAVPPVRETLAVRIDHRYAITEHRQIVKNAFPGQSEGQYQLVTGEGSVVTKFTYWNGDDEIRGELFERNDATQMYNTVTQARRDPGLLEEVGDGKFRYRIFPFAPNESKRVEIRWESWLPAQGRLVEYRTPIARPNTTVIADIDGAAAGSIRSETHEIAVEPFGAGVRVRTVKPRGPEGQFELRYELASTAPVAMVHSIPGREAFVMIDFPPMDLPQAAAPRDVTFVVDRSGSESFQALARTRAAVRDALGTLGRGDRVNVIAFDDTVTTLFAAPREATPDVVREARGFVAKIRDGAGTDLAAAIRRALETQTSDGDRERVIVLISDGSGDKPAALSASGAARPDVRLLALGVGESIDATFLGQLASSHKGFAEIATRPDDIGRKLARVQERSKSPPITHVEVDLAGVPGIELAAPIPATLDPGERVRVVLKCRREGTLAVKLRGEAGKQHLLKSVDVDLARPANRPWVETAWAKTRVDTLLDPKKQQLQDREEAIEIALLHDLTSKHTAFFAIPASETGRVKQQLADARRKKRDLTWARGDDLSSAPAVAQAGSVNSEAALSRSTSQVTPPPLDEPARKYGGAAAPERSASGRGCGGCTISTSRDDHAGLALLGVALGIVILTARRRRNGGAS